MAFLNLIFRNLNEPILAYSSVCINIACRNSLGLINCFFSGSLLPGYRSSWWQRTQLAIAHRLWTCTLLDCGCTSWRSHWSNTSSPCAHHPSLCGPYPASIQKRRDNVENLKKTAPVILVETSYLTETNYGKSHVEPGQQIRGDGNLQ